MNDSTFAVWPDGAFCTWDDLEDMLQGRSDDYKLVEIPDSVEDPWEWIEEYAAREGSILLI